MRSSKLLQRVLLCLLLLALTACSNIPLPGSDPDPAQADQKTPTPLPPDPLLERPTYRVKRGSIERVLEVNGRVTPVDLIRLGFRREGKVQKVYVSQGDSVQEGAIIAELQQTEAQEALGQAQDAVTQAQRDLAEARDRQEKETKSAQLALDEAMENLRRLQPGGDDDVYRAAKKALEEAQRKARDTAEQGKEGIQTAQDAVERATQALVDAQKAYSDAYWDLDWVKKYGTDPKNPTIVDALGKKRPNKINKEQREAIERKLTDAERALHDAERALEKSKKDLEKAKENETTQNDDIKVELEKAQRAYDALVNGKPNEALRQAQRTVDAAQLNLEAASKGSFSSQMKAIESAQRALEKAQSQVENGRITAAKAGNIIALNIKEGDTAQAFTPVVEISSAPEMEIALELGAAQMRELAEGQSAEVTMLTRPDVAMKSVIRRMPAPYGSGGSGVVQDQDQTTRIQVIDAGGQNMSPGTIAKVRIVLEHKDGVLYLPPEAIRSFEGRRFVIVREGTRERRITVRIGIETDEKVEVVSGLKEGDVIVGG